MTTLPVPGRTPLAFCVLEIPAPNAARTTSYPYYIRQVFAASGMCCAEWSPDQIGENIEKTSILVTVGNTNFDVHTAESLAQWVNGGGVWISIAGTCGQENLLGVAIESPAFLGFGGSVSTLGEGYLRPRKQHDSLLHLQIPLHYYNGIPVTATTAEVMADSLDAHGGESGRHLLTVNEQGKGLAICLAVDLTGALVMIQQGRSAVTRDGIPAPDGTAPVCDNVLKSGDAGALDWLLDRQPVPGVPGLNAFLQPIADQWSELLLRLIFSSAVRQQVALPVLWLYPHNLPAVAHISLDTDHNVPEQAEKLYQVLENAQVKATWCTIMPGLPADFMKMLHHTGHELAMHYDAMTDGLEWGQAQFAEQWRGLVTLFEGIQPVTNKNHYLRWQGDTELWEWCISHGIQLDQSKGASKSGEAGFNFGTSRPYFPVDFAGRVLDVLELPTTTQDLEVFAPKALVDSLITAVRRHHGVLHLLFHPAHIDKPPVPVAISEAAHKARAAGMEWWTSAQINAWERARRGTRWTAYAPTERSATLIADSEMSAATILWLNSKSDESATNARWGFSWTAQTQNITFGENAFKRH